MALKEHTKIGSLSERMKNQASWLSIFLAFFCISMYSLHSFAAKTSSKQPDWNTYVRTLERKVLSAWKPNGRETDTNGKKRTAIIMVLIAKDGSLIYDRLGISSGDEDYDEDCIKAIKAVSPFAPLPKVYSKPQVHIEFSCILKQ